MKRLVAEVRDKIHYLASREMRGQAVVTLILLILLMIALFFSLTRR
jgi:hypothetical protein